MDKFLNSGKRSSQEKFTAFKKECPGRQTKLHELKKVVILEDVFKHRDCLKSQDSDKEDLISSLTLLTSMNLTEKMILRTKIGKAVNALGCHNSAVVRKMSKVLVKKWTDMVMEEKVERVRVPNHKKISTPERIRTSARDSLAAKLRLSFAEESSHDDKTTVSTTIPEDEDMDAFSFCAQEGEALIYEVARNTTGRRYVCDKYLFRNLCMEFAPV